MECIKKTVNKGSNSYHLFQLRQRELAAISLERWFLGENEANDIELKGASNGNRSVKLLDDGCVVKETPKAKREFELINRVEALTNLTPRAGSLICDADGSGALSMSFFNGIPIKLLSSDITAADRVKIINGAFYAIGKAHYGDGQRLFIHGDTHSGNFIVIPNPPSDVEKITRSDSRLEIRIIDLEKTYIQAFTKKCIPKMGHDILLLLNNLICSQFISINQINKAIDNYLEANHRLAKKDLTLELEEARKIHAKLKATHALSFGNLLN